LKKYWKNILIIKMIGIYKITSPSSRVYIGQSIDIERRFRFYKNMNCKLQPILYASMKKYGAKSHIYEIIEECEFSMLNIRERYWQDFYNVLNGGLNCNLTETNESPKKHSEETKTKISNSNKGRKLSSEHKRKLSNTKKLTTLGENNTFYGKKHTAEFKKERSIKRTGGGNPNAKLVLNLETGIFYDSVIEVAKMLNINKVTLASWLRGRYPNKSSFIYV
jgi:group I intron endonuclease